MSSVLSNHAPTKCGENDMDEQLKPTRPWHPIELAILEHFQRYELLSPEDAVLAGIKGMTSAEVAAHRLAAMEKRRLIQKAPLNTRSTCYLLSPGAISPSEDADVDGKGRNRLLSAQSLLRRYAMLKFCLQGAPQRRKLTPEEFQSRLADMYRAAHAHHYYVTLDDLQPRIGFLRVDLGGRGRWDRIVAKARGDMHRHLQLPLVQQLLAKQAFEVAVVTSTQEKARRIHEALQAKLTELPVPAHCEAIPELGDVIRPSPH